MKIDEKTAIFRKTLPEIDLAKEIEEDKRKKQLLIAGNHLANALIGLGVFPSEQESYDQVLSDFGHLRADIWVAWKAIMDYRNLDHTK